jgi:tetratricopeptide (TPR) repeat protein
MDIESPAINYQLASLLLENRSFGTAAVEFEKTAYGYPAHDKSSQAGYAAVSAYREQLGAVAPEDKDTVKREVVRNSLKFADTFPEHEKAAIVIGAAADDLYTMKEYEQALAAANKLLDVFPGTDVDVVREAWLVIGHSSYELLRYSEAENAYLKVSALLPAGDKTRDALIDNLAASIYKQAEQANAALDYRTAADHFLRVGRMAPTSQIRPTAEYDAAAALIQLKDWETAASVLEGFRNNFPENPLQPEVTKKIAYVYKENNQLSLAANEYERIERESQDEEIRRDALLVAAEMHEKDGNSVRALEVYRRYVGYFLQPVELNLETRNKIAEILKAQNDRKAYLDELEKIIAIDGSAGSARTPRTRYLAAQAALVLAEHDFDAFVAVKLVNPFEVNLRKKRELMKTATETFSQLVDYEIGEITAAATFYLAEIYAHFSKALTTSERPEELSPMEREQYELAIEEQAYPFEEKAIHVHESNLDLMSRGVYNVWIEKSIQKLAESVPARYDKPEETSDIISSLETYVFEIDRPAPAESEVTKTDEPESGNPLQVDGPGSVTEPEPAEPAQGDHTGLPPIRTDRASRR